MREIRSYGTVGGRGRKTPVYPEVSFLIYPALLRSYAETRLALRAPGAELLCDMVTRLTSSSQ